MKLGRGRSGLGAPGHRRGAGQGFSPLPRPQLVSAVPRCWWWTSSACACCPPAAK